MSHVRRFDHIGITVADLDTATTFFVRLGFEVEGTRMFIEGEFLDTVIGIPGSRTEIVMLRLPDGSTRLELSSFVRPAHAPGSPAAMANELGLRNVAFEVDDIATARSGWTVVVTGQIERVDAEADISRLGALQLQTWAPAASDHYLRLRPELISGRRIPALAPPAGGGSGVTDGYPPDDFGATFGRGVSDEGAAETARPGFEIGEAAPAPVRS